MFKKFCLYPIKPKQTLVNSSEAKPSGIANLKIMRYINYNVNQGEISSEGVATQIF